MLRLSAALLAVCALLLAGCHKDIKNKDKVQEAILKRLQNSSGLDLKNLEVNTTSVSFDKDMAYATVAFHPKGDVSLNSGMMMTYTLQDRAGKWEVVKVGNSAGHGIGTPPAGAPTGLPPGHPRVDQGGGGQPQ